MPSIMLTLLVLLAALALLGLLMWLYIRSQQNDQRATNTINTLVFPLLGATIVTFNVINSARHQTQTCNQSVSVIFYIGVVAAIALICAGTIRTLIVSRTHDRIHITHAVLFTAMIVIVVFLVAFLNQCLF